MLHHLDTSPWFDRRVFWASHLSENYNFECTADADSEEEIDGGQLGSTAFSVSLASLNLFWAEEMQMNVLNGDWPEYVVPLRQGFEFRIRNVGDTGDRETAYAVWFWLRDSRGEEHFLGRYSGNHYLPALRWDEAVAFAACTKRPHHALLLMLPSLYLHPDERTEATRRLIQASGGIGLDSPEVPRLARWICSHLVVAGLTWECNDALGWICTSHPCARARLPATNRYVARGFLTHFSLPPKEEVGKMFAAVKEASEACGIPPR